MNPALRPMSLGEILDGAIQMLKSNLWLFAGIGLVPALASVGHNIGAENWPMAGAPFQIASNFVDAFGLAAACWAASQLLLNKGATVGQAYGAFHGRLGRLVGLNILQGLYIAWPAIPLLFILIALPRIFFLTTTRGAWIAIGIVAVPCCFLWARCALAFPATAVEDTRATASITRSVELGREYRWKVLWAAVLPVGIEAALLGGTSGLLEWVNPSRSAFAQMDTVLFVLRHGSTLLVETLFKPLSAMVLTLAYYDLRVRKEGLDILQMMEGAGLATDVPATGALTEPGPSIEEGAGAGLISRTESDSGV
jgi:hypothetical protein